MESHGRIPIFRCGFVQFKEYSPTISVVRLNLEKAAKPHPWFGPNWKKEGDHTCGLLQKVKRRLTTPVVWFKMKNGDQPHLWSD